MLKTLQNFYKATTSRAWAIGTGNRYVTSLPTPSAGYLVVNPSNLTKREIVAYTATGTDGNGNYITISTRGVGGTTEQTHAVGEPVRMNITAEHYAEIQDEVDDLQGQIDTLVLQNAPNASTSVKGIVKLNTAPVSATNPIAIGPNDPLLDKPTGEPTAFVTTSAGAADSGKGVKLNASGVLDSTFMPAEVVTETELQSHTLDIATTATNLGGSGSEVTLYTFTIPSTDVFGVNSGYKLRFYFSRNFTNGSGQASHIYFKFKGTTIIDQSFSTSNVNGWAELYVINQNATNSQKIGLFERIGGATNTVTGTTATVDTSSGTKAVVISVDAGTAGDTYVLSGVILEKIK